MTLATGYFLLGILVTLLLLWIARNTMIKSFENPNRKLLTLFAGLMVWHVYLYLMSESGFIADFSFPPKFFLTLILPAFLFTGFFIYANRNNKWITNLSPLFLTYVQVYRVLIETLFVYSVAAKILPPQVTIEGYNFDMIFAFTALPVAFFVFQKKMLPVRFAVLWNCLGLLVILSIIIIFLTSIYKPELYDSTTRISLKFTEYPHALVPGFLMPAAVFLHVLSLVYLKKTR